jgi:hypothetical protein
VAAPGSPAAQAVAVSVNLVGGVMRSTATPGEVLAVLDAVRIEIERTNPHLRGFNIATSTAAYMALRALGVVRIDQRGEPFAIDLPDGYLSGLPDGDR